jgi:uncharacterized protein YbjT (DUF2867 family)
MAHRKHLITGATGKTGKYVARALLDAGEAVRAFVHAEDERSDALKAAGAEIFIGDLTAHEDVFRATEGVDTAYFCFPIRPGLIQATAYMANAARRHALELVVNMSQISAREDSQSHAARDHWLAERVLDDAGVPSLHIRPTFFAEWLLFPWVRDRIVNEGAITLPYGEGTHAPIAGEDQARFIAAALMNPAAHAGKIEILSGPVVLDQAQIAEKVGAAIGRTVVYQPETMEAYRQSLEGYGLHELLIQHFLAIAIDYQNGVFTGSSGAIERVTGQAPMSVEAFVAKHRDAF